LRQEQTVRRLAFTIAAMMAIAVMAATPAAASWTVGAAATVVPAPCRQTGWSGDAAKAADGVVRGFARFQGTGCTDARLIWFEGAGGGWQRAPSAYSGRVLAVADDGAATWVLYAATDGTRLGKRDRAGVYGPSSRLSTVAALSGDLVAAAGQWWAVWAERVGTGRLASLFQAKTIGTAAPRQRITAAPFVDGRPSIARVASGTAVLAFERAHSVTGSSEVLFGRNPGSGWSFTAMTSNGSSRAPWIATAGQVTHLAWQQGNRIVHADNPTGSFRSHLFATPGAAPRVAVSAGRVFIAWTLLRGTGPTHVFLAERSGALWVGNDVTPAAATTEAAVAVAASGGAATVLGVEASRLWAKSQARPATDAFRRLGVWVDYLDYSLDPAATVQVFASHGVRTLYLQTARYSSPSDVLYPALVGSWIEQAHAAGIKVVGWYLPGYSEHLDTDVRRTAAIAGFRSPAGQRFDALAIDIEYQGASSSVAEFNAGVAAHLARVRTAVGPGYPVGAIVPAPLGMALNPPIWAGFPWSEVGRHADVVQPMSYWSYRQDCPANPLHCPYQYTRGNTSGVASRTGLPVHVIGGVGDRVTAAGVNDYVDGALDEHAYGGSLYDYRTTAPAFWPELERLNSL
jgi:hypothetical protein